MTRTASLKTSLPFILMKWSPLAIDSAVVGVRQAAFKSRLHQARLRVRAAMGDEALITAGG